MIDKRVDDDLQQGAVAVTVNRRLARSIISSFQKNRITNAETTWSTPQVLPFDAWVRKLYNDLVATGHLSAQLLDPEQEILLWQEILESSSVPLLNPIATARGLSLAWKTQQAYSPAHALDETYLGDDQRQFQAWSAEFIERLQSHHAASFQWLEGARLLTELAANISELQRSGQIPHKLYLAGYHVLTPQQHVFLNHLTDNGVDIDFSLSSQLRIQAGLPVVPDADPQLLEPELPEPELTRPDPSAAVQCSTVPFTGDLFDVEPDSSDGSQQQSNVVAKADARSQSFADSDYELLAIAGWAREQLESDPQRQIGIVIPDLHLRREQVLRIFDRTFFPARSPAQVMQTGRPYDISLGKPLADWPVVASALLILQMGIQRLQQPDLTRFLVSPYLARATSEQAARARFDRNLRKSGKRSLSIAQLRQQEGIPGGLRYLLGGMQKMSFSRTTSSGWCKRISELLSAAGWPGESALDSAEYQAFEAWQELLRGLAKLDDLLGEVDASSIMSALQRMARQRTFQPETPELPIQLLGVFESAGLSFDVLWVAGMDAGNWPPQVRPDPWLPLKWQKQAGVPGASYSSLIEDADAVVQEWFVAADSVIFSYARQHNGQPATGAFFLDQFSTSATGLEQSAEESEEECNHLLHNDPASIICQSAELVDLQDTHGAALDGKQSARGGARLFEDQASCPFRSYALHRLLARPLEDPVLGLDAREQGTAFHDAMEHFWSQVKTHENLLLLAQPGAEPAHLENPTDADPLHDTVMECVDKALAGLQHESVPLLALERRRLGKLILLWLRQHELHRMPFEVVSVENEESVDFHDLQLSLKVDRIDELETGERIIIDYKTGSSNSPARWLDDRPGNAQLPLYATVVDGIDGISYAQVTRKDSRFIGKAVEKNLIRGVLGPADLTERGFGISWNDNLAFWQQRLGTLANEVAKGFASVDPQPKACQYCHLNALCRIDPQARALDTELLEQENTLGVTLDSGHDENPAES